VTEHAGESDARGDAPGSPATAPGAGRVVLDLGPGVGALVLYAPADLDGAEIEISPASDPAGRRTHSLVRRRTINATSGTSAPGATADLVMFAAVYPGLPTGGYVVWRPGGAQAGTVTIADGQVTSWHWPDQPGDS